MPKCKVQSRITKAARQLATNASTKAQKSAAGAVLVQAKKIRRLS